MIQRIIFQVLQLLIEDELLLLAPDATLESLSTEICRAMLQAPIGSQFGSWLGSTLMNSALVEELYADDDHLARLLRRLG